jgi:hypothetical protein
MYICSKAEPHPPHPLSNSHCIGIPTPVDKLPSEPATPPTSPLCDCRQSTIRHMIADHARMVELYPFPALSALTPEQLARLTEALRVTTEGFARMQETLRQSMQDLHPTLGRIAAALERMVKRGP